MASFSTGIQSSSSTALLAVKLDKINNIPAPPNNNNNQDNDKVLRLSTKHNLSCFRMAIREHLFPVYKFCTNLGDLAYSTNKDSVCQIILSHTDLHADNYEACWNAFSGHVKRDLSLKRNNVVGQVQKKFKGKLLLCY